MAQLHIPLYLFGPWTHHTVVRVPRDKKTVANERRRKKEMLGLIVNNSSLKSDNHLISGSTTIFGKSTTS